jgi:hypothetical protein
MKILLDECVPQRFRLLFPPPFEVFTVAFMGFSGLKNGKLLAATESAGFDLLLSIDKNMDYQQNITRFNLILVILDVPKNTLSHVSPMLPQFLQQADSFEKGKTYFIT